MKKKLPKSDYPSKSYFDNAAKQFSWPIDHMERHILVPEDELQYAEDDLMVQHFRKHGWHIQSCISVQHTKVFVKPTTPGPMFRGDIKPNVVQKEQVFKCNQQFTIKSSGINVMIVEITKKGIVLKYMDTTLDHQGNPIIKDNIVTTEQNLQKSLNMGVFIAK